MNKPIFPFDSKSQEPFMSWIQNFRRWEEYYPSLVIYDPTPSDWLIEAQRTLGKLPDELLSFYQAANGLYCEWFEIFPINDPQAGRLPWNTLNRVNHLGSTQFLAADENLLSRFLVFAALDNDQCAVIERTTNLIWYEEEEQLHEISLTLEQFIETCLIEVHNL